MPAIPAFGRQRQKGREFRIIFSYAEGFQASLGCMRATGRCFILCILLQIKLTVVIIIVCMMCMCVGTCATVCMWRSGHNCGVNSLLPPLHGFRGQVESTRLTQQAPLTAEPFYLNQVFIFFSLILFLTTRRKSLHVIQ